MTLNVFAFIIIATLVFDFGLKLISSLLNLTYIHHPLPEILQGIYNPEEYRKSQEYLRVNTQFSLGESGFNLLVLLVFWLLGGFGWFDGLVKSWNLLPEISGVFYIGLLFLGYSILQLPFNIYDTFVIEEKFGFNRTTIATFTMDLIKGFLIGAVLGGLILTGILYIFQYWGTLAWLYCWFATIVFSLAVQYVAPTWIMPLFNKFKPMETGELKEAILKYAASVNFSVTDIYVMDGSKRSSKSNAFFTGFGKNKRIALFDTLIAQHTTEELVAILAHEVGHYKKRHIVTGMIINIIHTGVILFLLSLFISAPALYQAFNITGQPVYAGILFFGLLYTPLELILSIFMQMLSRRHEKEADRFAAETVNSPSVLVNALKKLSSTNLSNLTPHPFYVFINYSHPPLQERITAAELLKR